MTSVADIHSIFKAIVRCPTRSTTGRGRPGFLSSPQTLAQQRGSSCSRPPVKTLQLGVTKGEPRLLIASDVLQARAAQEQWASSPSGSEQDRVTPGPADRARVSGAPPFWN